MLSWGFRTKVHFGDSLSLTSLRIPRLQSQQERNRVLWSRLTAENKSSPRIMSGRRNSDDNYVEDKKKLVWRERQFRSFKELSCSERYKVSRLQRLLYSQDWDKKPIKYVQRKFITINMMLFNISICFSFEGVKVNYTEKICRLKSHRLCVILVDRLESRLNIMNLLMKNMLDNRWKCKT